MTALLVLVPAIGAAAPAVLARTAGPAPLAPDRTRNLGGVRRR